jgi:hypothetical protein
MAEVEDEASEMKTEMISDIGIPNGPAEYRTRGLLKAHYPKNKKIRDPKMCLRKR